MQIYPFIWIYVNILDTKKLSLTQKHIHLWSVLYPAKPVKRKSALDSFRWIQEIEPMDAVPEKWEGRLNGISICTFLLKQLADGTSLLVVAVFFNESLHEFACDCTKTRCNEKVLIVLFQILCISDDILLLSLM
jgi:hypothetical protein